MPTLPEQPKPVYVYQPYPAHVYAMDGDNVVREIVVNPEAMDALIERTGKQWYQSPDEAKAAVTGNVSAVQTEDTGSKKRSKAQQSSL